MSAPAGWYPDATRAGVARYWDGTAWTQHLVGPPPVGALPPAMPPRHPSSVWEPLWRQKRFFISLGVMVVLFAVRMLVFSSLMHSAHARELRASADPQCMALWNDARLSVQPRFELLPGTRANAILQRTPVIPRSPIPPGSCAMTLVLESGQRKAFVMTPRGWENHSVGNVPVKLRFARSPSDTNVELLPSLQVAMKGG